MKNLLFHFLNEFDHNINLNEFELNNNYKIFTKKDHKLILNTNIINIVSRFNNFKLLNEFLKERINLNIIDLNIFFLLLN